MTARDVIAQRICKFMFGEIGAASAVTFDPAEETYNLTDAILADLLSAPDSVRQELATLLNPWRPIEGEAYSGKYVLVFRPNATTQKMRIGTDVWDTISSGTPCWWHSRPDEQPTRWLPLPAPPKEDKAT